MGSIMSVEQEINSLRFVKIKKGSTPDVVKAMHVGESAVILKLKNGTFTVVGGRGWEYGHLNGNCAMLGFGTTDASKNVLDGLVRMGVVSKEARANHMKRVEHNKAQRELQSKRHSARRALEALDIDPEPILGPLTENDKKPRWR